MAARKPCRTAGPRRVAAPRFPVVAQQLRPGRCSIVQYLSSTPDLACGHGAIVWPGNASGSGVSHDRGSSLLGLVVTGLVVMGARGPRPSAWSPFRRLRRPSGCRVLRGPGARDDRRPAGGGNRGDGRAAGVARGAVGPARPSRCYVLWLAVRLAQSSAPRRPRRRERPAVGARWSAARALNPKAWVAIGAVFLSARLADPPIWMPR